ncbi:phage tail tube protein [Minwuia thermotolerans]|uniref:Phage tail protein n=1 Tax=Minwuia thermotolerans TaxID=2056226 RepID=A0A2M9G427_9PROT|nr:phage tail tube protein [Minwuia thermotolerans]PJK29336.1 hypothetical protein CVT23_12085 [Minwuia thermotolerans]PJK30479.1 hypothetical protein CVT23_05910 [Minwuia thermotolerans]PJK30702.1 hypothetical protein CVT23_04860 [Minwuia thermotolerans]
MPYDYDEYLILAKTEVTEGTDPTPAIGDAVLCVGSPQWNPLAASYGDRELVDGRAGAKKQFVGAPHATLGLSVELAAGGDDAALDTVPHWAALLLACGFAQTVTADTKVDFQPVSADYGSVTIHPNIDGVDGRLLGARGNAVIEGRAGQVPRINFQMLGLRQAIAAAAQISGSLPAFAEGLPVGAVETTITIGGEAMRVSEFSIDCGRRPSFDDMAGHRGVRINRRRMSGRISLDLPTIGTKNLVEEAAAAGTQAIVITHGASGGDIVEITMPAVQIKTGQFTDRDGVLAMPLDLQITPSSGDDEITITTK